MLRTIYKIYNGFCDYLNQNMYKQHWWKSIIVIYWEQYYDSIPTMYENVIVFLFFFTVHRNISKIHDFRVCIIWKLNIFAILKKTKFHTFWFFPHSWLITVFVTRVTRRVPFVDQQLFTLPEHMSLSPVVSGVRVTWPLVLCVMFCRSLFVLLSFFSGHCVVSPSPIDEFD